jgi:ribonuclease HI
MKKQSVVQDKGPKVEPFVPPNAMLIFTDGSYRPDGNAACAYLIYSHKAKAVIKTERFAYRGKTINQMELQAINKALDHPNMDYVLIHSDSAYSIMCLTIWRHTWAKNNWITPLGEPVKNKDLIMEIGKKLDAKKFVRFIKIKAHTGDPFNSMVDYMAGTLTAKMRDDPSLPDGPHPV